MYRLSYERRGDISFIARETISYFVTSERSERGTKYDIVTSCCSIHILVPLSGAKIRLYFQIIYTLSAFRNKCKITV